VDTNAFFPVTAVTHGLSAEQTQAQIQLHVTDGGGAEIAGDLRLLAQEAGAYKFGWSARAPLAVGDRLNVVLTADPSASGAASVGGSFELSVVGPPAALPEPELVLTRWARYYQGTGEPLTCRWNPPCTSRDLSLSVPGALLERVSAQPSWLPPATNSFLAWRLRWWTTLESADGAPAEGGWNYWGFGQDPVVFGHLALPDRHCVTLQIEDLRSGETRRAETCAEPGPLERFATDTRLQECSEPPSAALTQAWCNLKGGTPPQCAELPAEQGAPGTNVVATSDPEADDSWGCQLGSSSSGGTLGGAAIAALALLGARRRRKT
jgi:MYXO-CTERM domain-containing protein